MTLNDDGSPTINPPLVAGDPGNIIRIELKDPAEIAQEDPNDTIGGKNPRGLVLNSTDTRAYVMDFLSRDIAIVDVSGDDPAAPGTLARLQSADLPPAGTDAAIVQREVSLQHVGRARRNASELPAAGGTDVGFWLGHLL